MGWCLQLQKHEGTFKLWKFIAHKLRKIQSIQILSKNSQEDEIKMHQH